MRVAGYCRVSTSEQADHGVSLEAQAAKLQAYALVKDWELLEVIHDAGASAKSLQREGLTRLLGLVERRQVEAVCVAKLDRLTRSASQWQRDVIGGRTREALQHLKAQGKRYCHTVYTDAAIIDRMHHMRAAGRATPRSRRI